MSLSHPDLWLKSIYEIDFEQLKKQGIKGFIFDIDNTLVAYSSPEPTEELIKWLAGLQELGFQVAILSNANERRVTKFARNLGIKAIHKGLKPMRRNFIVLSERMGLQAKEIAMVGDQIFTDIYGGNRFGAYTILVDPIRPDEPWFIKLKRFFEKPVMRKLKNDR